MTARAALLTAAVLALAAGARAWEARASDAERRLAALNEAWGAGGADAAARAKSGMARQKRPGWTRRSHWTETYQGKTYVFGVGRAEKIENAALRVAAAEDRARAEIAKAAAPGGGPGAEAVLQGARPVDWYQDRGGRGFYALVLLIR